MNTDKALFDVLRSAGFAAIGVNFVLVGTLFTVPPRLLKISNFTNINLIISDDGINNKDIVASNGFCLYDFGSNKDSRTGLLQMPMAYPPVGIWVKQETGVAAASGNVYVTVVYASSYPAEV